MKLSDKRVAEICLDESRRKLSVARTALRVARKRQALEHMTVAADYLKRAAFALSRK